MDTIVNPTFTAATPSTPEKADDKPPRRISPMYTALIVIVIVVLIYLIYRKYSTSTQEAKDIKLKNTELIDKLNQIMLEP